MRKKLQFFKTEGWGSCRHEIVDFDTEETVFWACDLSECPEDAIIGRDLFDGYDYITAVKFGMKLAQQGYTDIEIDYCEDDEY